MSAVIRPESLNTASPAEPARHAIVERLSHELRTPLNSVIGFSRVLQGNRTGNQRPADLAMLEAIRANGERLLALIEDLVALSVSPPVCDQPVPPLVNLANIAEDVVEKWADVGACKGVIVALEVETDEPIRVDPMNLARLLDKLIGNAVKFTPRGGVKVTIARREDRNAPASIVIEDSGIGIPKDRLASIFEPFAQVNETKSRDYEGAGLGLPIARALAHAMECTLTVDSEPGTGTRVVIELPK
ncbi:MAG: multi-sensor hybrid histidine kinase [Gemmatimonadetes bacterium]|nr:multi-sensor hybrid histidine kinase [Gemmatimonadota bacterium]